jgi:large subunit ribosomal protein L17
MRHRVKTVKLQRKSAHRRSLLANLACSLIEHGRIRTTLAKAKALRPVAERMVTLGKRGDLHARRQAVAFLHQREVVKKLFDDVAPAAASRRGGYCRITRLGPRPSDAAPMAFIEWVDRAAPASEADDQGAAAEPAAAKTPAKAVEATAEESPA